MARLVAAQCPICGANVRLDPDRDSVTCTYCGKSSFIERKDRPRPQHPPGAPTIVVPAPGKASFVGPLIGLVVLALVVFGAAVGFLLMGGSDDAGADTQQLAVKAAEQPLPGGPSSPSEAKLQIQTKHRPLFARAQGGLRVLLPVTSYDAGSHTYYAAYDAKTGNLAWKTPELGKSPHELAAVVRSNNLVLADEAGQLTAYSTATGKKQWTTALGDRVRSYCAADEASKLLVETKDDRLLQVDVSTGGQGETKSKRCDELVSTLERRMMQPEPGRHPDTSAPPGLEAHSCGGARVVGSRNFVVPDQCRPRLRMAPNDVKGMRVNSIWKQGDGWLLRGTKSSGTSVPMLGFARPSSAVWTAAVPSGNPLEAGEGPPSRLAVDGERVMVAYYVKPRTGHVTAFDLETGRRSWDVALPPAMGSPDQLEAEADALVVLGDGRLVVLDGPTGKLRFSRGTDD